MADISAHLYKKTCQVENYLWINSTKTHTLTSNGRFHQSPELPKSHQSEGLLAKVCLQGLGRGWLASSSVLPSEQRRTATQKSKAVFAEKNGQQKTS